MGKIVAIGGGRYSDGEIINIFEKIVSLADKKNPKVLFLPTAAAVVLLLFHAAAHLPHTFHKTEFLLLL